MPSDRELQQNAMELADFRRIHLQHHESTSDLIKKYAALMEDYQRLRTDYEEARGSRGRYMHPAKEERKPFVLLLVNGNEYVFHDDLVGNAAEGGQQAASMLNDAVKRSIRGRGLQNCRVMVRIYANMVSLSKALGKLNLIGREKRSLASFAANFTRYNELFDFVDSGELRETADLKMRALLRQFVDNAQCKHIYFAGCHDPENFDELTAHTLNRARITLVRTGAFHPDFTKLGMSIEEFPDVFRTNPLDGASSTASVLAEAATNSLRAPASKPILTSGSAANYQRTPASISSDDNKACPFFAKGHCKHGNKCRNLHVNPTTNGQSDISGARTLSNVKRLLEVKNDSRVPIPLGLSDLTKADSDAFSDGASAANASKFNIKRQDPTENQSDFAAMLPHAASIPEGTVPINADQQRLDPYAPPPSLTDQDMFSSRTSQKKLCNSFHLSGDCPEGDACPYDHAPVPEGVVNALQQVVFRTPCPRKGRCRRLECMHGHVCQNADCGYRGGKSHCKFPRAAHAQDLNVAAYVDAEAPTRTALPQEERAASTAPVESRASESVSWRKEDSSTPGPKDEWNAPPKEDSSTPAPKDEWNTLPPPEAKVDDWNNGQTTGADEWDTNGGGTERESGAGGGETGASEWETAPAAQPSEWDNSGGGATGGTGTGWDAAPAAQASEWDTGHATTNTDNGW